VERAAAREVAENTANTLAEIAARTADGKGFYE
jgi:hypothetical protein